MSKKTPSNEDKSRSVNVLQQENNATDKQFSNNRRRIFKASLATGVVLSSPQWSKPLINAVVLPAHAQTSGVLPTCSSPTVSFSATSFDFDSDIDGLQSSTLQITNTADFSITLQVDVMASAKGEVYSIDLSAPTLAAGESTDLTLSVDFASLSSFCDDFDNSQVLLMSASMADLDSCPSVDIDSVPSINIAFECPCVAPTVSFSATSFDFNSDIGGDIQSSTLQITNTSDFIIFLSVDVTASSSGEIYTIDLAESSLAAGASTDLTLTVDFTGLPTFCVGHDNMQSLSISATQSGSDICPTVELASVPSIVINFGC